MKILTGRLRGRTLLFKFAAGLRPTSDRVRKAIFDMLQGQVEGSRVLDLFSGTGALGIEALSLGAREAVFVETEKGQAKKIEEILGILELKKETRVIVSDAFTALERLSEGKEFFDLVFADPPYERGLAAKTLEKLFACDVMSPGGFFVLECSDKEKAPAAPGGWRELRCRTYGDTKIILYQKGV